MSSGFSRPIYLHFFDREFLGALRLYHALPIARMLEDLRWVLLSSYEHCFCSTSLVFENRFAQEALKEFPLLFAEGHIQLALREPSLADFIETTKRPQYEHAIDLYPFYYDSTWQELAELGPQFIPRQKDTSREVERSLRRSIESGGVAHHITVFEPRAMADDLLPFFEREHAYLTDLLLSRGHKAVTKLLFGSVLERYWSLESIHRVYRSLEFAISEAYISSYLDEYGGTIATGLASIGEVFTHLCLTYPLHDLRLWRELYLRLGIMGRLKALSTEQLVVLRSESIYIGFVEMVRSWWVYELEKMRPQRGKAVLVVLEAIRRAAFYPRLGVSRKASGDNLFALLEDATHIIAEAVEDYNRPVWLWGNYLMSTVDRKKVFVVHGRNDPVRRDLFSLLRAASLNPTEFSTAVVEAGGSSMFIQGIIDHAMDKAQAIVILFCPEEHAQLRDELVEPGATPEEGLQPRPNVLFEAGLALGRYPERTIVVQVGDIRPISDLGGRHFVKLNNTAQRRKDLLSRLAAAGCSVDLSGQDWLSVGDFGS